MKTYTKKAQEGELLIYKHILNKIADQYNEKFSQLILPKSIAIDDANATLTLPYYDGETFNGKWDESNGGLPLGLDLCAQVPVMLRELATIDISAVDKITELKSIPRLIFHHEECLRDSEVLLERFLNVGIINKEEGIIAKKLTEESFTSSLILNNGDFYPRNFIRMPDGKIVLIDWETWNDNSPTYSIDYPENVAAVCFVQMWSNQPWQKKYVEELRNQLSIRRDDFQRALIIKSLQMANFWFGDNGKNELCRNQIRIFKDALSEDYMKTLWG